MSETENEKQPTSVRLSPRGKAALTNIVKHLQKTVPSGVKVNNNTAIEHALIETSERINQKDE